jgi:hypothetical protein
VTPAAIQILVPAERWITCADSRGRLVTGSGQHRAPR